MNLSIRRVKEEDFTLCLARFGMTNFTRWLCKRSVMK